MGSDAQGQTPSPAPAEAAPAAGGGVSTMMIVAIVVVIIVVVGVIGLVFLTGGSIEGKWTFESAKVYNADGSINQNATDSFDASSDDSVIEFKSDGTVIMGDNEQNGTWTTSGDQLTITTSNVISVPEFNSTTGNITYTDETHTDTMVYTYSVSRSTLTLEFESDGMKIEITAKRA